MRLRPSEALVAATINAAHAIGMAEEVGSLEPGKAADLLVLDLPDYREMVVRFGTDPIAAVVKRGRVVWQTRSLEAAT
jgi:imidazolonepropionase